MILRDYQLRAVDDARALIRAGRKRIIIHSGTGTGKTVIASEITKSAVSRGHRVLFLAHRKELIDQAHGKLHAFGVDAGVLMASDPRRKPWSAVCVASVPTLVRRDIKPKANLLIIDECHRAPADSYLKILKAYPGAVVLGLTATPIRSDSRGLGDLFETMVSCPSVAEMMQRIDPETGGPYLVSTRVFAPPGLNLNGVHVARGDYKSDELAKVCDKPRLIGSILENWQKHASGRQTVVFATSVEHSQHIVAEFLGAGVKAEHLDGTTPKLEREAILRRLEGGETTIVSNVGVLTEGWDSPPTSCVVLARPTKSTGLFLQMCGRALRPYPGKVDCLILDHANCHAEHGFVDDEREWSLDAGVGRAGGSDQGISVALCKRCFATFRRGPAKCPYCGWLIEKQSREIAVESGALEEIKREKKLKAIDEWRKGTSDNERRNKFEEFRHIAATRGYKKSWPYIKFKVIFGHDVPKEWSRQTA